MTRLEWGTAGERFYEAGIDRGVLYVDGVGVPWNGLVSVTEASTGGEATPFYIDGYKYSNESTREEFAATISAYTYPDEFAKCDGSEQFGRGLFATKQRRRPFNFSYRSKVGNDINGSDHGYKIHLVYNATAAPSQTAYATIGDSVEASNFSWSVTTRPPAVNGIRPTAHFVVDSRETDPDLLSTIEAILYGSETEEPRIPSIDEIIYRFESEFEGVYDAGIVGSKYYVVLDGGVIPEVQSSTVDGGVL